YLVTLYHLLLALRGTCPWEEVLVQGAVSAAVLGAGALGLGALAVEGDRRSGALAVLRGNAAETLALSAVGLWDGLVRSAAALGVAWLTWWTLCETIAFWGGENVKWVRWGLDGILAPAAEGGLYTVASWLAALWFFLLCGAVLAYPVSNVLRWGAACYLRARQQAEEIPPGQLELSEEEQAGLAAQRKRIEEATKRMAAKTEERAPDGGGP